MGFVFELEIGIWKQNNWQKEHFEQGEIGKQIAAFKGKLLILLDKSL